jgi:hypothetical protein
VIDDPDDNPFTAEKALARQGVHAGSTVFQSEAEMREYERVWNAEHKAILRAYGQTPEGEEPDDLDEGGVPDDLDDYDEL